MSVPFITSRTVSNAEPVIITAGTDPADFTTSEDGPRNRKWTLTSDIVAANMPDNPYRAAVVVDNIAGASNAWIVFGQINVAYTEGHVSVPSGSSVTFSRQNNLIGTGVMSVILDGASSGCTVTELSFES